MFVLGACVFAAPHVENEVPIYTENDCKCFEEHVPVKQESGAYRCASSKTGFTYSCSEEKPPICRCTVDGKTTELPLGYTNCITTRNNNGSRWCDDRDIFDKYFEKHPEYALYD